ncbi:hypothetical protein OJ998_29955, partial [Solirubrobacter taibaiensis]|nr:hypothetical protein [Solirubrobacter taibaiensis]
MHKALGLLADVFEAPAANAAMLDDLRARWRDLTPEERAALTPLAQHAASRVAAAQGPAPGGGAASQ